MVSLVNSKKTIRTGYLVACVLLIHCYLTEILFYDTNAHSIWININMFLEMENVSSIRTVVFFFNCLVYYCIQKLKQCPAHSRNSIKFFQEYRYKFRKHWKTNMMTPEWGLNKTGSTGVTVFWFWWLQWDREFRKWPSDGLRKYPIFQIRDPVKVFFFLIVVEYI